MSKAIYVKQGNSLVPADEEAWAFHNSIKDNKEIMIEGKPARNPRQHRLFFKLLSILIENTDDQFETIEQALIAVKIGIGEIDPIINAANGETVFILRSIAFESCDQTRFNRIFEDALALIVKRWLIGSTTDEIRQRVFDLVDNDRGRSLGRRVR